MVNYSVMPQYTYVWIKYRPALLRLMIAASDGPQEYKFADHEFRRLNPREKRRLFIYIGCLPGKIGQQH